MDLPIDFLQFLGYPTTRQSFRPPKKKLFHKKEEERFHIDQIIQRKKEKQTGSKIFKYLILSFLVFIFILVVSQRDSDNNEYNELNPKQNQQNINTIQLQQQSIIAAKNDEIIQIQKIQEKSIESIDQQLQGQINKDQQKSQVNQWNEFFSYFFSNKDQLSKDFQSTQAKKEQNQKNEQKQQALGEQELQSTTNLNDDDKIEKIDTNDSSLDVEKIDTNDSSLDVEKIDTNDSSLNEENILIKKQTRVVLLQQAKCDSQKAQLKSQFQPQNAQQFQQQKEVKQEDQIQQDETNILKTKKDQLLIKFIFFLYWICERVLWVIFIIFYLIWIFIADCGLILANQQPKHPIVFLQMSFIVIGLLVAIQLYKNRRI